MVIQGKPNADTEAKAKTAAAGPKAERNLEIGRNAYEANGKEVAAAAVKPGEKKTNGEPATSNGTTESSTKALDDLMKGPEEKVNCFTCGIDCTRVYYHNGKTPVGTSGTAFNAKGYNVCPNCFIQLRLPTNQEQNLYVKMENPSYSIFDKPETWSDEEILRLLEGLEKFDDSWTEIAEHVGTRTRDECALKFLQLEIEDKYIDTEPVANGISGLNLLGPQGGQVPFTQADNPVMSVVGYLASLTDPAVVAAAAGRSVEEMRRSLAVSIEPSKRSGVSDKGKAKEGTDMMEIDAQQDTTVTTTTTTTTTTSLRAAATIPLAATAARAAVLASHQEREMTALVSQAVNLTLQKLELKLEQFNEMESIIQAERRELERARQQLFLDRLAFKKRVKDVQEGLRMAASTGGDQGIKMAQEVMAGGEKFAFQGPAMDIGVQPLSAEGQVKTFDV